MLEKAIDLWRPGCSSNHSKTNCQFEMLQIEEHYYCWFSPKEWVHCKDPTMSRMCSVEGGEKNSKTPTGKFRTPWSLCARIHCKKNNEQKECLWKDTTETTWMFHLASGTMLCGHMRQQMNFFCQKCTMVWSVCGCFAASGPGQLAVIERKKWVHNCVRKIYSKECQGSSLSPEDEYKWGDVRRE